jgi:hypothetical protein
MWKSNLLPFLQFCKLATDFQLKIAVLARFGPEWSDLNFNKLKKKANCWI